MRESIGGLGSKLWIGFAKRLDDRQRIVEKMRLHLRDHRRKAKLRLLLLMTKHILFQSVMDIEKKQTQRQQKRRVQNAPKIRVLVNQIRIDKQNRKQHRHKNTAEKRKLPTEAQIGAKGGDAQKQQTKKPHEHAVIIRNIRGQHPLSGIPKNDGLAQIDNQRESVQHQSNDHQHRDGAGHKGLLKKLLLIKPQRQQNEKRAKI